jgi:hypothetical protein
VFLSKGVTQEDTCQKAIWGCLLFYCFDVGFSVLIPTFGVFTAIYLYKWRDNLRKGLDYRVRVPFVLIFLLAPFLRKELVPYQVSLIPIDPFTAQPHGGLLPGVVLHPLRHCARG